MLDTPTPFPFPGSMAVFVGEAITLPVRIMSRERDDREVAVSVQGKFGASANKSVPLAMLKDPTPLSTAEFAELNRLDSSLIGYTGRGNAATRRAEALRDRYTHAKLLDELLAKVPARYFPAAATARRERLEGAAA
jgi:hypothetical protein